MSFRNGRWRAFADGIDLEHADLRALEGLIERQLAGTALCRVAMRFDSSSLPRWMRQHQAHYFNYVLRLAPRAASDARS